MRISVPNSNTSIQQSQQQQQQQQQQQLQQESSALNLPLQAPLRPCLATGTTVAKEQAVTPAVSANGAFLRTAKTSLLGNASIKTVDASLVQYGVSPVPESAGWTSMGGTNNKVIDASSNLDTRVVSFKLLSQSGQKLVIKDALSPMTLLLPLKNPLVSSSSSSIVSSYSRLSLNITCPGISGLQVDDKRVPAFEFLYTLKSSASATSKKKITLSIISHDKLTGRAIVSVPCGSPIGIRNITCSGRNTSFILKYDCPSISLQPVCAFWNETLSAWSSSGCVVAKHDGESISCSCNHTTNFAARFVALADMQEDLFSTDSLSALAKPEELIRLYPHVFIIIGVIAGFVLISSIITYDLDVRASQLFYETLRTDPEIKFLERIESLKGNVFFLDRVMDDKIYALQDKIARARLQRQAKEIADLNGWHYTGYKDVLPVGLDINKFDWKPKKLPTFLLSNLFSFFFFCCCCCCHRSSSSKEADRVQKAEKRLQAPSMQSNPMQLMNPASTKRKIDNFDKIDNEDEKSMTSVTIQSKVVLAPSSSSSTNQGWLQRLTHEYTRAIYSRVKGAFDNFKVSANSNFSVFSKAAGIPSSIIDAMEASKENEYLENLIDAGQENIEEILHEIQSAPTWTRFMKLRGFLVRTWVLYVLFNHPYFSIFTKYDPRNPRYLRMLKLSIALIGNLWTTTFLFSFVNEGGGVRSLPETIVVALLSCLLQVPISLIVAFFIRNASVAEFDSRYPFIAAELRRRTRVEEYLGKMSQTLLEAELKNVAVDYKQLSQSMIMTKLGNGGLGGDNTGGVLPSLVQKTATSMIMKSRKTSGIKTKSQSGAIMSDKSTSNSRRVLGRARSSNKINNDNDDDDDVDIVDVDDDDVKRKNRGGSNRNVHHHHHGSHAKKSHFGPVMKNQAKANALPGIDNVSSDDDDEDDDDMMNKSDPHNVKLKASDDADSSVASDLDAREKRHRKDDDDEEIEEQEEEEGDTEMTMGKRPATDDKEPKLEDDFSFGWINAPLDVQRNCSMPLWCCGRHPQQRAAYIERMKKMEEQTRITLEKKKKEAEEKRKNKKSFFTRREKKKEKRHEVEEHPIQHHTSLLETTNPSGTSTTSALTQDAAFVARNATTTALGVNVLSSPSSTTTTTTTTTQERDDHDHDRVVKDDLGDYHGSGTDTGDESLSYLVWFFSPIFALCCKNSRATDRVKTVESFESIVQSSRRNLSATTSSGDKNQSLNTVVETQDSILKQAQSKFSTVKILPCTVSMLIAIAVSSAILAFQLFYISLFGFRNDEKVTLSLTITWALSQGWSLFFVEPGMSFVELIITFVIRPAWLPYLLWIPHLGPIVAGKVASDMVSQDGKSILSGRMQNLTLVKAAGAASQLSPELAVVAYGFGAVISATLSNVEDKLLSLSKKTTKIKSSSTAEEHQQDQHNDEEDHDKLVTAKKLSQRQRHELIVHRYILAQLHSVEEAQRDRRALAMKLAKVASVKGWRRIGRVTKTSHEPAVLHQVEAFGENTTSVVNPLKHPQ